MRNFLTGSVGRRVFLLVILSAFIPLALVGVLSLSQVREVLLQQAEQRLAATSKAYGMAIFDRLLLASEAASAAIGARDWSLRTRSPLVRYFKSLGIVDPQGKTTVLLNESALPPLSADLRGRLATGKPVIIFAQGKPVARVFLAMPDVDAAAGTVLFGELSPEFLWGDPDLLPAATEFCVVDDASRIILLCTAPAPEGALNAIHTPYTRAALRSFTWNQDQETHRAVAWRQFMHAEFGIGDWIIVASQLEGDQLSRIGEFRRLFIPVVLLALLIVTWLSLRQIRSTLVPIEALAAGARRIAHNDFATRVDVNRGDEFGELATAFNQMSARLGHQFSTLTALAEIDHLILSSMDAEQTIRAVLERIGDLVPADFLSITLLDHDNPNLARTYACKARRPGDVSAARQEVSASERNVLEASPRGCWIPLNDAVPGYLSHLQDQGMATAYVQPVIWRDAVCGALALGFGLAPRIGEEDQKQIRDFADRVAVAISSARRDEQLYQQAHFDSLTGLPNRLLLRDRLTQEVARCQQEAAAFALLFLDLDHFKNINDTLGHASGDAVLREAGRRISLCLRESDTVSRLGGDEFNVILTPMQNPQDAGRIGELIVASLSEPFVIDGQNSFLSASIGIALFPEDGNSAEALITNADTAMYRAKSGGRAQAVYFEETMNAMAVAHATLDRELRRAIDRGQLRLLYQPLIDQSRDGTYGAEALLRWEHPELGSVSPVAFIPIAEESGYIEHLGRWAMLEACRQMKQWQADGVVLDRIAVNVSARQFRTRGGLVDLIKECTRAAGIAPSCLEVEITESVLIDHQDTVERTLQDLVAMGVRIALDDFGTGFSSMSYLKRFPVHTVKIDRVFVKGLPADTDSEAIVAAIIAMAHALGKTVTAEGVETDEQRSLLRRLKCDCLQGFLFARPLPPAELAQFVMANEALVLAGA
ncbi:MAG: EAL domain-containing protein [Betaproteobacteria bacterium]